MSIPVLRILMVEDDEGDFVLARELLRDAVARRFEITWAKTLQEARRHMGGDIDAVLLDLTLPDSMGWETFVEVHRLAPQLPVVLLTGIEDEDLGSRAIQEGAQDYLVKGKMDGNLLCRSISYAIERKKTQEALAATAEELRERDAQITNDLNMARDVQHALLPRQYPAFSSGAGPDENALRFAHVYRPCQTLGGDFFNILPVSDTEAVIFICDVMGHGVRSALVTAIIRGLLQELAPAAENDPARLLTGMNRDLTALLHQPNQLIFVTAACLMVDTVTGRASYAGAGHPSGLRRSAVSGRVSRLWPDLDATDPPLGVEADCRYTAVRAQLNSGDKILLFTDGLTEVSDPRATDYGEDRLARAFERNGSLPPRKLCEAIVAEVEAFAAGSEQADDLCLVVAELVGLAGGRRDSARKPLTGAGA